MNRPGERASPWLDLAATALDHCAVLIIVLDRRGRIIRFNRVCERLTGHTSGEAEGKPVWDIFSVPDEARVLEAAYDELRAGRAKTSHESHWVTGSGERRLIAWDNTAIRDEAGELEYIVGTGIDVTEQRQIEQELAKFRLGIERSGEIIFLTDRDGAIRYVNPAFERVYGYSEAEVLGKTPRILKSGLHPPERDIELWRALLAEEVVSWEFINKTKDGRLLTVDASLNQVRDEAGRIIGFLAIQRDITHRTRTEKALQASEERLRILMEKVPDGVGVLAPDGCILYANPAVSAMIGYSNEELLGKRVGDLQHPDDRARAAGRIRALFEHGVEYPSQYRLMRKDGSIVPVEVTSRAIEYDGRPALLSTVRDLTERLWLEEQLRHAQKMDAVGKLAGGVAHDFNNLLTVIQASCELIQGKVPVSDADLAADFKALQTAVARGKEMIAKLLAFSRHEELEVRAIELGALIAELEPTLRRLLPENIEIELDLADDLPPARAAAGSVERILINLATNARDAMPDGGRLGIELSPADLELEDWLASGDIRRRRFIRLAVSDTGFGMDEDTRSRVFEPFFTAKPFGRGTGLGLAVVYGLAKQLEGHALVRSDVGEGTTVEIYLPVAGGLPGASAATAQQQPAVRGGTETILIAEDEPALRRAAKRILERLGYTVLVAADGEEALRLFEAHESDLDLIMTDIVMPRMGGRALHAEVRARGAAIPFLFSSGYAAGDLEETARLDPSLPFLPKPWTLRELAHKVREVIDARL